ncbi:MAG: hypothetical protein ACI97A_003102, partial [Planctomycetota bacterium]
EFLDRFAPQWGFVVLLHFDRRGLLGEVHSSTLDAVHFCEGLTDLRCAHLLSVHAGNAQHIYVMDFFKRADAEFRPVQSLGDDFAPQCALPHSDRRGLSFESNLCAFHVLNLSEDPTDPRSATSSGHSFHANDKDCLCGFLCLG